MLIDISSATLRKMVKLSERKEALMSQIQELDRQMIALQEPGCVESRASVRFQRVGGMKTGKPRMQRGALKGKIVGALRAAGARGMTIQELSGKLIHVLELLFGSKISKESHFDFFAIDVFVQIE